MTPKQKRLQNYKRGQMVIKTKRIVFGVFFISITIISLTLILGALNG